MTKLFQIGTNVSMTKIGLGLLLAMAAAVSLTGQDRAPKRFRIGISHFSNVEAGFGSPATSTSPLGPEFSHTNPVTDRTYDDGYVRVDATNNDAGKTWNWGMDYSTPTFVGNSFPFNKNSFSSSAANSDDDADSQGVNLSWVTMGKPIKDHGYFSVLASMDFNRLSVESNLSGAATLTQLQDLYDYSSFNPALVSFPYAGTYDGPGPLLSDTPVRSINTITGGVHHMALMELEGNLLLFGVGGEYSHQINDRLTLLTHAKYMFGWFNGDFDYEDHFLFGSAPHSGDSGSYNVAETLTGSSIGLGLMWNINDRSAIFFSANKIFMDRIDGEADGRTFYLDLESGIQLTLGYQEVY
jgi:hypothetical protein